MLGSSSLVLSPVVPCPLQSPVAMTQLLLLLVALLVLGHVPTGNITCVCVCVCVYRNEGQILSCWGIEEAWISV